MTTDIATIISEIESIITARTPTFREGLLFTLASRNKGFEEGQEIRDSRIVQVWSGPTNEVLNHFSNNTEFVTTINVDVGYTIQSDDNRWQLLHTFKGSDQANLIQALEIPGTKQSSWQDLKFSNRIDIDTTENTTVMRLEFSVHWLLINTDYC